ncbi:helix-turn-helix domain-containing protein [Phaeacidiphilus oryzae]|uniref:helix-turn-helix domain-containing protein n=1 Tax=Phaeacidiphilus oryzae TaxID=348818 RepID=UPI0009FF52B9|nr:helix-turn-helix domain-containing protein [Phaeacidiphilus oryzae]
MTSGSVTPAPALPPVYSAAEVAAALRCSEWWVKEQARKGCIPFTKPGGTYRFTAEHVAEILRIYEGGAPSLPAAPESTPRGWHKARPEAIEPVRRLKARPPRRTPKNRAQSAA